MRLLIITDALPYPPVSGGVQRIHSLLRRVAALHEVWLVAPTDRPDDLEALMQLKDVCQVVATATVPRRSPSAHLPGLLRHALAGRPLELKFHCAPPLLSKVNALATSVDFDIVQIEYSHMALCLDALPPEAKGKRLLTFVNVEFSAAARVARLQRALGPKARAFIHSTMMRRWEPRYSERFDCCIAMSEADRALLLAANPRLRVEVVPNGVDTARYRPLPPAGKGPALVFVGNMSHLPCADGVVHFCQEVLPRLRARVPEVQMWIVGANPPPEVKRLGSERGIHVTGTVPDVRPYYERATAAVVPLRSGGGTRLKVLEALALGRPVVSTSPGCEGLDVRDGQHLLVADDPEAFAERTAQLLNDADARLRLVTEGRRLVVNRYDWDVSAGRLLDLYKELVQ